MTKRKGKHNCTGTRLHNIWMGIKRRCYGKNDTCYKSYGAKGIILCEEWHEFVNFKAWSDVNGYKENLVIDRRNTYGNYEPSNCRWITQKDNTRNTSRTKFYTFNGETKTLGEWGEILNIAYMTLFRRLEKGKSVEEAFTTPVKFRTKKHLFTN